MTPTVSVRTETEASANRPSRQSIEQVAAGLRYLERRFDEMLAGGYEGEEASKEYDSVEAAGRQVLDAADAGLLRGRQAIAELARFRREPERFSTEPRHLATAANPSFGAKVFMSLAGEEAAFVSLPQNVREHLRSFAPRYQREELPAAGTDDWSAAAPLKQMARRDRLARYKDLCGELASEIEYDNEWTKSRPAAEWVTIMAEKSWYRWRAIRQDLHLSGDIECGRGAKVFAVRRGCKHLPGDYSDGKPYPQARKGRPRAKRAESRR